MNTASRFELFIAGRYLRARRKEEVISVITAISIVGVAAGVMALIIALAVNSSFRGTLQRNLLGAMAHIDVQEKEPGTGIEHWEALVAKLRKVPHVVARIYDPERADAYQKLGMHTICPTIEGAKLIEKNLLENN